MLTDDLIALAGRLTGHDAAICISAARKLGADVKPALAWEMGPDAASMRYRAATREECAAMAAELGIDNPVIRRVPA